MNIFATLIIFVVYPYFLAIKGETFFCPSIGPPPTERHFESTIDDLWRTAQKECYHPCNWNWKWSWITNGCSAPGVLQSVMKSYPGIQKACQIHDVCYFLGPDQEYCDEMLLHHIKTVCKKGAFGCTTTAHSTYLSLYMFGKSNFKKAQQKRQNYCVFGKKHSKCTVNLYKKTNFSGKVFGPYFVGDYTTKQLNNDKPYEFKEDNYKARSMKVTVEPNTKCKVILYKKDKFKQTSDSDSITVIQDNTEGTDKIKQKIFEYSDFNEINFNNKLFSMKVIVVDTGTMHFNYLEHIGFMQQELILVLLTFEMCIICCIVGCIVGIVASYLFNLSKKLINMY